MTQPEFHVGDLLYADLAALRPDVPVIVATVDPPGPED